jgi:hypothetical protein
MDHAPGPIIATVPASVARTMEVEASLGWVIATHSSITAINAPIMGVQRPTRRSVPAQAHTSGGTTDEEKGVPVSSIIPKRMSKMAVSTR